jgi:ubiquinone/menaquinone biosynthesis C-methylase UbiE
MLNRPIMKLMLRIFKAAIIVLPVFCLAEADVYKVEANRLADLMNWKQGDVIAEIGAGQGQMSFSAAVFVGAAGHVYATELDDKKIDHLKEEAQTQSLQNVTIIKSDPIATNLPDACCEAIFMRRVYHHFLSPARTDAALFRDLKPGGLIAVIDFPPRSGLAPVAGAPKNHGGHGVPSEVLVEELKAAGFQIVNQLNDWPEQDYCVIARKPPQGIQ